MSNEKEDQQKSIQQYREARESELSSGISPTGDFAADHFASDPIINMRLEQLRAESRVTQLVDQVAELEARLDMLYAKFAEQNQQLQAWYKKTLPQSDQSGL